MLDFTLAQFTEDQRKALAGWYKHFTVRYPVVGRLREYVAWPTPSVVVECTLTGWDKLRLLNTSTSYVVL